MKKAISLFILGVSLLVLPQMAYAKSVSGETTQPNKFIVIVSTIIIILVFSLFKWWKDRKAA
ncbi:hypothetical protein FZC76_14910 [Sutcliffiella horikoshii]|uniref:Uncharacterized protein n=1 Tax=Sutcliffiella horikoshii TaxID=79883 RepID=A0A5D4T0R4_9BACI|nr:hypothetical protein [Sutcliffiella horikoshii]TYS67844.1 hypothetical protein FZC76_14910 [Sutcliffiella horikoshii]